MTPKGRLAITVIGLITFTGLVITLLVLGQPAAAISSLILVIVLGVQQLLQALEAVNHLNDGPRPATPLPQALRPEADNTRTAAEDDGTDEKAA